MAFRFRLILALGAIGMLSHAALAGWTHRVLLASPGDLPVGLWVPDSVKPGFPVGVLMWLHGGMTGPRCDKGGEAGAAVLPWLGTRRVIVVSPSACGERHWFSPEGVQAMEAALDSARRLYPVDLSRLEIVGVSDGGLGALSYSLYGKHPVARRVLISAYPGVLFPAERIQELVNKAGIAYGEWILLGGGRDALFPAREFQAWISRFANRLPRGRAIWESQGEHDFSWWARERPELLRQLLGRGSGG